MSKKPIELRPKNNILSNIRDDIRYGLQPKKVECNTVVISENEQFLPYKKGCVTSLIRKIANNTKAFKIGISGDIDIRMNQRDYREKDKKNGVKYTKYQVVFETNDKKLAKSYEVTLVERYMRDFDNNQNREAKEATRLTTYDGFYKIYVVYC